jgi:pimeloyl-ACP methyl ester carboxylesterase
MTSEQIEPAPIAVPEIDLDDLRRRLVATRWPDCETVPDGRQGAPLAAVQALCRYWEHDYDWRRCETMINGWGPARTEIDGLGIHFLHIRSPEPDALPVIMTHGWPGSVVEFHQVIGPLTDPRAHGSDPADALHLVLPSLPGYGWSDQPTATGWNLACIAQAWTVLMQRLGYENRWAAQGGDWGAQVTSVLAGQAPPGCIGIHLNSHAWSPNNAERASADVWEFWERDLLKRMARFQREMIGYSTQQGTRPQTLGYGLSDSPAGQAAWIYEKYCEWTDHDGDPTSLLGCDAMLDNIMFYWLPDASASAARLYWEVAHSEPELEPVDLPVAFSQSPRDIGGPSRRWAERRFPNIVHWHLVARGGHFAAFEQPEIFVDEVRTGFRAIRAAGSGAADPHVGDGPPLNLCRHV